MATYKSKTFTIEKPADEIASKFADLRALSSVVESIPEEERQKIGDITFDADAIHLNANMLGQVSFNVVERTPHMIKMQAVGTPVPLTMDIKLDAKGADATEAQCALDVDIPMMLRPMVAPQLQKAVDMLGDVIAKSLG